MRALGIVVALVLSAVVAATAHANFPSSITTTVPPGGYSSVTSPTLDPSMKSATVDVKPASAEDKAFFDDLQTVLSLAPSPGKRLMLCIGFYIAFGQDEEGEFAESFLVNPHPLAVALLLACLEMAGTIDRNNQAGASAAGTPCGQQQTQVPATFTRVGKRWQIDLEGQITQSRAKGRLKVTCRRRGAGLRLKVRPRKRGASLKSVVGPRLAVGLYNPLDAAGSGSVKLTFRR